MFQKNLIGLAKAGTYKVWSIIVNNPSIVDGSVEMTIKHGQDEGKLIRKTDIFKEGKQGRTAYEQAVFEAESRIKTQLDKNYRETKEELVDLPVLAMLAQDHTKKGKTKTIEEGVFTSDKFDGVRCLAFCKLAQGVKTVNLKTRTGQDYNVPHIASELLKVMNVGDVFDGELYVHGPALQEINSAVTNTDEGLIDKIDKARKKVANKIKKDASEEEIEKAQAELTVYERAKEIRPTLQYHIFDVVVFETPFEERFDLLDKVEFIPKGFVVPVEYRYADSIEVINEQLHDAINRGFEGLMYRTKTGEYESGKRSNGIWKYKLFMDSEFLIKGSTKDKQGGIIFIMKNDLNDREFNCVLGDYNWRLSVADDDFSGQYMTIQYQSRYKRTLLPQFPSGKVIRKCDENGNPLE